MTVLFQCAKHQFFGLRMLAEDDIGMDFREVLMDYSAKQLTLGPRDRIRLATGEEYGFLLVVHGLFRVSGKWFLGPDDLLVCRQRQTLELAHGGGKGPGTVLWVRFPLGTVSACSGPETDLLRAFEINPSPVAAVRAQSQRLMLIKSLAMQLISLRSEEDPLALELLEQSTARMFLAMTLRACASADPYRPQPRHRGDNRLSLDQVFRYIHAHLTEEITLETLEREFFVSRHHLIREFRKRTGQTVHRYIIKARLDLCRQYIAQGYSITEVYRMGGFGGYNHFFRAFKQAYGMTPGEYRESLKTPSPGPETRI